MNYKVLALSGILTVGLIAVGVHQGLSTSGTVRSSEHSLSVSLPTLDATGPEVAAPALIPAPGEARAEPVGAVLEELGEIEASAGGASDTTGSPKIAYRYGYSFRLPATNLKPLQELHADRCERLGSATCRILAMEQSDAADDGASGMLHLAIAADRARAFGKDLATSAEGADGELTGSAIEGEDLSKDIVDTEARLRARIVLRDRLMDVLRNRRGTVKELVEAERGVAQVNEEIDQARSWLAETRSRVEFSRMSIEYRAWTPARSGFAEPIADAWSATGATFGSILAVVLRLLTVLLPLALIAWLGFALWKLLGRPGLRLLRRPFDDAETASG